MLDIGVVSRAQEEFGHATLLYSSQLGTALFLQLKTGVELGIDVRWLPRATPELNAMDHLWKHVKANVLANQPTCSMDQSAEAACQYILGLSRRERLRKAGILSGRFWLAKLSKDF